MMDPAMASDPATYFVPFVYLIPAVIALYISWVLWDRARKPPTEGASHIRLLFWLCAAEGIHNSYYFIATLLRMYKNSAYEAMMLPLPWLFVQGIIAVVFLMFGIRFLRERDVNVWNVKPAIETATRSQDLATKDSLTGLNNRRTMEQTIEIEVKRAIRSQRPFTIMMFDVDRFKAFNDTHGHQRGDALLVSIARLLKKNLRSDVDIAFRCGGDEFLVLLPDTSMGDAQVVAERLKTSIASLRERGISLSIGLLMVSPTRDAKARDIVASADSAMCRAKKEGGDRIEAEGL
jgi:diguanylate cyclase (GGDEF)-like protein